MTSTKLNIPDRLMSSSKPQEIGSTTYHQPAVKQALKRVRSGDLSKAEFHQLYSGHVRAGMLKGRMKHTPGEGSRNLTLGKQMRTLKEL